MGLGLASVQGIVRQHGGWVDFSTELGFGTEFYVFLPRASTQPSQAPMAPLSETILLVEPDDKARGVARYFLTRSGYRVIEVDSSATALGLWEGQGSKVDLLVVAENLPGDISGHDLAQRLRQTRSGLKVAYIFDPNVERDGHTPAMPEGPEIITKPFSPERLLAVVQTSLGRRLPS
jgi:DNA-binding response OmpR family regulator